MNHKLHLTYAVTLGLYAPALFTNYGGNIANNFWDFYESTFVLIALIDFAPLMTAVLLLRSDNTILKLFFAVTGAWMLIFAMPDIYMSYIPLLDQAYFADYKAWFFGDVSVSMLLFNLISFWLLNTRFKSEMDKRRAW